MQYNVSDLGYCPFRIHECDSTLSNYSPYDAAARLAAVVAYTQGQQADPELRHVIITTFITNLTLFNNNNNNNIFMTYTYVVVAGLKVQ
jgi:hypothetical protein